MTDTFLHTHRKLGGFIFPHDEDILRERESKEWAYILDGQQRATSLLISMQGGTGKVKDNEKFDYTLYFDASDATFFFSEEFEERKLKVKNPTFLIRIRDVPKWGFTIYKEIALQEGYNQTIEKNIENLVRIFKDYTMTLIKIKGVKVNEVCDIFERINQEGKKLDQVDIIVAKTYRNEDPKNGQKGFYLRDNLKGLKDILISQGNRFQEIDDLAVIQMIAICLRKFEKETRKSFGITSSALDHLTTEILESSWSRSQKTILETVKFLHDLKILGPDMLPYGYLAFPISYYLHENKAPNKNIVRQWFWRTVFDKNEFRRADEVYSYCTDFFDVLESGSNPKMDPLELSKKRIIGTSYQYRNAFSRAVMAFLANQKPLDFSDPEAEVLDNVYLRLPQTPQLHHIYPQKFLAKNLPLSDKSLIDSLMNICFLRAITNNEISDNPPSIYFKDFEKQNPVRFDEMLKSHLINRNFLEKPKFDPEDYKEFLKIRAELFCQKVKEALPDVEVKIIE